MKEIDICKSLDLILQKGFCTRTVERARSELLKIKNHLTDEEYKSISYCLDWVDSENPDVFIPEHQRKLSYSKSSIFYDRSILAERIKGIKAKYEVK